MVLPKGPGVIYTGKNTEMKITWQSADARAFQLEVGTDLSYALARIPVNPKGAGKTLYSVVLCNLSPGTRYFYRLVQGQGYTGGSFITAPDGSASRLKFVSYGDSRTNPQLHDAVSRQVVELFTADAAYQTLNLALGDLVTNGDDEGYWETEFFHPDLSNIRAQLANLAFIPVRGNHEHSGVLFSRYFPYPYVGKWYWSFDYGPAHFTVIDQYSNLEPGSAQYQWLVNDLASTQKAWKFVALHQPGWSAAKRANGFVRDTLQPLLEQYGIAILFAGHDHFYSRAEVNGVQHLTIGTGGAPSYDPADGQPLIVASYKGTGFGKFEIDGDRLTGWFIDSSGQARDTFMINR